MGALIKVEEAIRQIEKKPAKTIKILASFLFLLLAHYFTFTSITFFAASALEPPTKI